MVGQTVSHYNILEKLGEGGMGVVYKAQDTTLDRIVALKFLPEHASAGSGELDRFIQEAKAAAGLNHPNICTIHGIESEAKRTFIVMEYVDGNTLRHLALHTRTFDAILPYALQIAEGLEEAHKNGIVHRDIKADNVMVNSKNHAKIMDFGLAKLQGSLKLTKSTSTVGTLAYMAPEQIQGADIDTRADIFSFGVLLFEMITGRFPFRGEHEAAMMYSIMNENPADIEDARPGAPPGLSDIIRGCLKKNRVDRFQNMGDVLSELRKLRQGLTDKKFTTAHVDGRVLPASDLEQAGTSRKFRKIIVVGAIALIILAAGVVYLFNSTQGRITSIAVLPFANTVRDPDLEYLSDGLTENVINNVSKIPGLKVISWRTSSRFKGTEFDAVTVGKELRVAAILSGRMMKRDTMLHVSAELVDASDNTQLWGEQYVRRLEDLLQLQAEISTAIAGKLQVRFSEETQRKVTKLYTDNKEAYEIYLKGRYQWNKRTPDALRRSIDLFNEAIKNDASYALAYAGLADAYTVFGNFNLLRPQESFPKAKSAALKALELDETLVEAHTSLGYASMYYDWDWAAAERSLRRALDFNPNYSTAHSWYSFLLTVQGRFAEAGLERSLALDLDPFSPAINTDAGISAYFQGEIEEAIRFYERALEVDPLFVAAYVPLGGAYARKKEYDKAMELLQRASMFSSGHPIAVAAIGYIYAMSGKKEDARMMLELLQERAREEYVSPYWVAILCTGLNNSDQALKWLERALKDRDGYMVFLNVEPVFEPLRNEPRFQELLKKMGF